MKKQRLSLSRRQAIIGVVFLLPFLIHFSMFLIYPFFSTAYTSLTNVDDFLKPNTEHDRDQVRKNQLE